jgi:hypothetical protein
MCLSEGSLFFERYNTIIFHVTEAGLISKWWEGVTPNKNTNENQDFVDEKAKDEDNDSHHINDNELYALPVSHLQVLFVHGLWD